MNPTDLAFSPDRASLLPEFSQRLEAALASDAKVLHCWHAWQQPLTLARDAALQSLRARGQRTQLCGPGEFLPLLQTLNTLIADSLREQPLPTPQQAGVWVVEGAERLNAEHQSLIERILSQFPELPLRLLLLSQTPLAPHWPAQAQTLEVAWRDTAPPVPAWQPEEDLRPVRAGVPRAFLWLGAATLLALTGAGAWWGLGGQAGRSAGVSVALPAEVASEPVALPAAVQASQAASAAASEAVMVPSAVPPAVVASAPVLTASVALPVASAPAPAASAAPAKAAASGPWRTWLQTLPEGSFVVLHGQFASAREAEAFKAADPVLANARIVQAVWTDGQAARYGVLTGPFRSAERVSNYLLRLSWRAQARSLSREALLNP